MIPRPENRFFQNGTKLPSKFRNIKRPERVPASSAVRINNSARTEYRAIPEAHIRHRQDFVEHMRYYLPASAGAPPARFNTDGSPISSPFAGFVPGNHSPRELTVAAACGNVFQLRHNQRRVRRPSRAGLAW